VRAGVTHGDPIIGDLEARHISEATGSCVFPLNR